MKTLLTTVAMLTFLGSSGAAFAGERTATIRVRNMTCAICHIIVERAIATIPGVKEIVVSPDTGTATVVYNDRATNPIELAEVVAHAGFPAWPMRR